MKTTNRRIKVFLSGVVNLTNAQNLNCLALARHLDPKKFEVRAMTVYSGDLNSERVVVCSGSGEEVVVCSCSGRKDESNIHSTTTTNNYNFSSPHHSTTTTTNYNYHIPYPAKIWQPIRLVRGILWSDVAYLCKPEYWKLQRFVVKLFHKKAFQTVEGAFIGTNLEKALTQDGTKEMVRESLSYTGNVYSITEAMKPVNERVLGLKTKEKVLYLGAETDVFKNEIRREKLTDVAMIGGNLFYKGLNDFFELAKRFPQLTFHVIGSGMGKVEPKVEVEKLKLKNVVCHGSLSHGKLAEVLKDIQLHIFPSRAEGFPKVTLETAAAGVPSLVYDDYGAGEWIRSPGISGGDEVVVCSGSGRKDESNIHSTTTTNDYNFSPIHSTTTTTNYNYPPSGFVVKTLDEMAGVVQMLIDNPSALQLIADGAREMARRFDWKVMVKDWEREIEKIAEGRE